MMGIFQKAKVVTFPIQQKLPSTFFCVTLFLQLHWLDRGKGQLILILEK